MLTTIFGGFRTRQAIGVQDQSGRTVVLVPAEVVSLRPEKDQVTIYLKNGHGIVVLIPPSGLDDLYSRLGLQIEWLDYTVPPDVPQQSAQLSAKPDCGDDCCCR